jgi:trimethylamine--corrinoid protein Co-methyltransferase
MTNDGHQAAAGLVGRSPSALTLARLALEPKVHHDVRENLAGLDVSQEELALDVIEVVGPLGRFLEQRHTGRNLRKLEFSELTTQPTPEGGYGDPIDVAREKTDWILENHHPEPLDEA